MKLVSPNPITSKPIVIQESVSRICFTAEFLAKDPFLDSRVDKENSEKKGYACSVYDETRLGNTASWKLACHIDGKSTVSMDREMKTTVSSTKVISEVKQVLTADGKSAVTDLFVESLLVGECTDEMPKP